MALRFRRTRSSDPGPSAPDLAPSEPGPALPTRPNYVFEADGIATVHYSPFLSDLEWSRAYDDVASEWFEFGPVDARWRMWVLTSAAQACRLLPGNFAEFGVFRAGCARMILSMVALPETKRLFLFDTFAGIPGHSLAEPEHVLAGELANTSVAYVTQRLERWSDQIEVVEGDVFDTLALAETGSLAFVHMDLNVAAATRFALEYAYKRMVRGALMVFDDYGWAGLEPQREIIEAFVRHRPEELLALPTGQALLVKR